MFKRLLLSMVVVFALVGCKDNNEKEAAVNLVTVTTDGNGQAGADMKAAAEGQQVTLTATPDPGYEFSGWVVLSGNLTLDDATANPLRFTMPGAAVSFKATFRAETVAVYPISVTAGPGGSVNWGSSKGDGDQPVSKPKDVPEGYIVALSAEPTDGYRLSRWNVLKGDVKFITGDATSASVNFRMPAEEVSIEAEFEEAIYDLSIDADIAGGTVASSVNAGGLQEGTIVRLTATAEDGYLFRLWDITGLDEIDTDNLRKQEFIFKMPANDVRVSAVFSQPVEDVVEKIADPVFKAYVQYCMSHEQEITVDDYWYAEKLVELENGAIVKKIESTVTPVTETYPAWDTDGDGRLSETEAAAVRAIDVSKAALDAIGVTGSVKSLASNYYFSGVELLRTSNQELGTLDTSEFPLLKTLICDHCGLGKLNIEKCVFLEKLFVEHNLLTGISLGSNKKLYSLSCWDNNIGRCDITGMAFKDGKFFLRFGSQRLAGDTEIRDELPFIDPELSEDEQREEARKYFGLLIGTIAQSQVPWWNERFDLELPYNRNVGWSGFGYD